MLLILAFSLKCAILQATLTAAQTVKPSPTSFPNQVILQSPVLFENIAVRASSELLLTSFASPTLFTLDPHTINGTLAAVHTFPNATALTGLAEYRPGVFALVAAIVNTTTLRGVRGSAVIWSIDLTSPAPAVRVICALPSSEGANGMTAMAGHPDVVLVADSIAGGVWQIDVHTGNAHLAIQDASMLPDAPAPALGINGLHVHGASPYLYFSNSQHGTLSRVALGWEGLNVTAASAVETLVTIQSPDAEQNPDDFALDREGRAWVTVHPGAVALVSPPLNRNGNWSQSTVLGDAEGSDGALVQPTSAAFGRGSALQEKTLYVVTAAGQIVAVNTSG
jgi:hypothetical protein